MQHKIGSRARIRKIAANLTTSQTNTTVLLLMYYPHQTVTVYLHHLYLTELYFYFITCAQDTALLITSQIQV